MEPVIPPCSKGSFWSKSILMCDSCLNICSQFDDRTAAERSTCSQYCSTTTKMTTPSASPTTTMIDQTISLNWIALIAVPIILAIVGVVIWFTYKHSKEPKNSSRHGNDVPPHQESASSDASNLLLPGSDSNRQNNKKRGHSICWYFKSSAQSKNKEIVEIVETEIVTLAEVDQTEIDNRNQMANVNGTGNGSNIAGPQDSSQNVNRDITKTEEGNPLLTDNDAITPHVDLGRVGIMRSKSQ